VARLGGVPVAVGAGSGRRLAVAVRRPPQAALGRADSAAASLAQLLAHVAPPGPLVEVCTDAPELYLFTVLWVSSRLRFPCCWKGAAGFRLTNYTPETQVLRHQ